MVLPNAAVRKRVDALDRVRVPALPISDKIHRRATLRKRRTSQSRRLRMDMNVIYCLVFLAVVMLFIAPRVIKCVWCGGIAGGIDHSELGDSSGICPSCAEKMTSGRVKRR